MCIRDRFYAGTSYRHCLIWKHGNVVPLTPPHDIREREIKNYLPDEELLLAMQKESYKILENHPINQKRREKGLNPANKMCIRDRVLSEYRRFYGNRLGTGRF